MTRKKSRGFTLTEIMVVIAIIGILAGIVFVAMGPARKQAKDTRIKSDMLQLRNLAENFYLDEGNYDKVICDRALSPEIAALCDDIDNVTNQANSVTIEKPSSPYLPNRYCAYAPLNKIEKTGAGQELSVFFCIDYIDTAKEIPTTGQGCNINLPLPCEPCLDLDGNGRVEFDPQTDCRGDPVPGQPDFDDEGNPIGTNKDGDFHPYCDHVGEDEGDPGWDPRLDIDKSGTITIGDILFFRGQDGAECILFE